ncbi:hypothetical protein QA649_04650 [Bradyrhizobium sp. CB1717]|uniref:hypothetical protein n=1 Tax=Bradyrhizobium sp. CB1717 TaxID=3039154 RepID=UPI0024B12C53|nr:hypothetical protein [Bradyrhizobium sp. CB1717]WFU25526.1 hypothetical protein QA649_04650 [Bradyrhizobium sp. CB1717]
MVDLQQSPICYSIRSDPKFGNFIEVNSLLDPSKLRAFDPNKPFPVRSLTLMAAWKVVAARGGCFDLLHAGSGDRALLITKNGKITISDGKKNAKAALVGFHIAGVAENHPEMIWDTLVAGP